MIFDRAKRRWARLWMKFSGAGRFGRISCGIAGLFSPPFYGRIPLAQFGKNGFFSSTSTIHHSSLSLGRKIFIGDDVLIYEDHGGGSIELGSGVHLHNGVFIQTGSGGSVSIGDNTHIQPRCQLSAYKGKLEIGRHVEIAPNCSFYTYDHAMLPGTPISQQPLRSQGGIKIEDDVWIGVGVIVLDGVCIGRDAVVGAGSVVTEDIPPGGVAVGVPARVIKSRYTEDG